MPRTVALTSSFGTGELSPSAYGRVDIEKYAAGLTCCQNYQVDPLGGIVRRAGTRFVCETKFSQFGARVLPFEFSVTQAYVLEAGCQYLRFYKNNAPLSDSSEKLSNGEFDASLTNWTTSVTGTGTAVWTSDYGGTMKLRAESPGGTALGRQDAAVTANLPHVLTFEVPAVVIGSSARVQVGTTTGDNDLSDGSYGAGSHSLTLTSTTTTMSVTFSVTAGLNTRQVHVDSVSLTPAGRYEITTPYDHSQLPDLDVVQSADEQYWLHGCHATRKLQRYADTCWRFNCVTFAPPPSIEYGSRVESDIQPSALTGTSVTITAFNNLGSAFLAADKGREIQVVSGANAGARAGIHTVSSASVALAYVCVPFNTTGLNCAGTWKLSGSPMTTVNPDDIDPVGKSAVLTLSLAGFRGGNPGETDVGKFAIINGGCYEITCVASTTVARSIIRGVQTGPLSSAARFGEAGAWSVEEALWSCRRGYASTGDFFEDRLWLDAGFRFCGSRTGDYESYGVGVLDDEAVVFAINSKTINAIRSIIGARQLQIFTAGGEWVAVGGTDSPITPTNVRLSSETSHGSSGVTPLRVNDVTLFLTRYGRQLREFTQRADVVSDAYVAPDLLVLAEHLTRDAGIVALAYQREPTSTIWAVRADGVLLSCAYRREENVVAWARHVTCGAFESVTVVPHPDNNREQVWFIVNRTINGVTKRYVEYLDDSTLFYDRRLTDSAVVFNNSVPVTTFTVPHLAGETVAIQADGVYVGTCVAAAVTGLVGIVTPASKVEIGLPYESVAVTLEPEVAFGAGSIQPMKKHWARLFLRVKDSCAMQVRTPGGQAEYVKDARGVTMAGAGVKDYDVPRLGDFIDGKVTVLQSQPLPSHLLMLGGVLDINEA